MIERPSNPFVPRNWTVGVEVEDQGFFAHPGGGSIIFLEPDPERLWFVITRDVWPADTPIWPFAQTYAYGIQPETGQKHILIHNATYPGAVQQRWYLSSAVPLVEFTVITGRMAPYGGE